MIRPARLEDAAKLIEFQCAMALETEGMQLHLPTVTLGVQAVLKDSAKGAYWVVERDGALVGCMLTIPEWSDWRNGTVLWIHSVYVVAELRRAGIFRELYEGLRARVESDAAFRGLRLYVEQKNTKAQATYESLGMTRDHYFLYEWLKG